jgi:cold-inducible RNA-binding protein
VSYDLSHIVERTGGGGPAESNDGTSSSLQQGSSTMKLYIGNLSYDTTEGELQELFSSYGSVESVHLITDGASGRSKGFGFVEYRDDQEAKAAIAGLNGTEVRGRAVVVNEARPKTERGGFGGGRGGSGGGRGGYGGGGGRGGYGGGQSRY